MTGSDGRGLQPAEEVLAMNRMLARLVVLLGIIVAGALASAQTDKAPRPPWGDPDLSEVPAPGISAQVRS